MSPESPRPRSCQRFPSGVAVVNRGLLPPPKMEKCHVTVTSEKGPFFKRQLLVFQPSFCSVDMQVSWGYHYAIQDSKKQVDDQVWQRPFCGDIREGSSMSNKTNSESCHRRCNSKKRGLRQVFQPCAEETGYYCRFFCFLFGQVCLDEVNWAG